MIMIVRQYYYNIFERGDDGTTTTSSLRANTAFSDFALVSTVQCKVVIATLLLPLSQYYLY